VATGSDVDGLRAHRRPRPGRPARALDAHAHSAWFGMTLLETELSGVGSVGDVYGIIGDRAPEAADRHRGPQPADSRGFVSAMVNVVKIVTRDDVKSIPWHGFS
jgi:hypothetical protein